MKDARVADMECQNSILRPFMPELDALRGVAILMVIFYHGFFGVDPSKYEFFWRVLFSLSSGGWLGVQLFFVLSGFLITGILLDTCDRPDYFSRFYTRRTLRILPAYLLVLVILGILGVAQWPFLLASVLFLSNLAPLFGVPLQYPLLWSLAVEEHFYLLWPQAVRRLSRRSLAAVAVVIVLITPVIRWVAFSRGWVEGLASYTWFTFDGLAIGALLAMFIRSKYVSRQATIWVALTLFLVSIGILMVGAPFGILHRTTIIGAMFQLTPWYCMFAGCVALILFIGTSKWRSLVTPKWLRYFGRISYGLYLVHVLIFTAFDTGVRIFLPQFDAVLHSTVEGLVFRFIIIAGVSTFIAALSREYLEEYFLKFKDRTSRRSIDIEKSHTF